MAFPTKPQATKMHGKGEEGHGAWAPGLRGVLIHAVRSAKGGTEIVAGKQQTQKGHGGQSLVVFVRDFGYGSRPVAWMNGIFLGSGTLESLCGNKFLATCKPGDAATGVQRAYNLYSWHAGLFVYQNTDEKTGKGYSTSIEIR
jgi:hypothetical protein